MALIQKTLFPENIDRYNVFVQDTNPNSRYFNITELPDTFTGGKNAFLIAGSPELVADTLIKIEIKDAAGNIIYQEPGEGTMVTTINGEQFTSEYYEGVSKVISVYVYPGSTAYGPCTITILGELSSYYDDNGLLSPIPLNWEGQYNVKWQKTINVNPTLANTTKIRFYKRPTASINEILSPIYRIESGSKVDTGINQSFANIRLSNLETFAGDVKRVKVFRTSQGDISDYDLIQDILIESKELLTSYGLTGSVVGNTGILTSTVFDEYWDTGSLKATLDSNKVETGVKLSGSGNFKYITPLDLKSTNTYEINLDAFYSASIDSNLGIYLSYLSQSTLLTSSVGTLYGITPTKNLLDTTIPFTIDKDYPSASLYFSQSNGEWHLGNISLKLSEDTAFSPDEVSFITAMPSVVGNEDYNFRFEFYDVNNNYVPVAVTSSANFNGGNNNIGGTLTYISASASSSAAQLASVSSSISGTMTVYSASASGSLGVVSGSVFTLSGSVSASISSLSSSVSSSNVYILSSSLSKTQQLADGQFSGSFIGDTVVYSPTIGGQQGYISQKFQVGNTNPIILDARTSTRKIYIGGVNDTGSYSSGSTSVYMDSTGKFSLKDKLTWDGSTLGVSGTINANAGTFSGNITSTATISGGTISGGTISGGTISIGSGNSIFKADTNGIYLGNATFASAPFRVSASGALTATGANITGAITATSLTLSGFSLTGGDVGLGNVENYSAANQAKVGIEAAITIGSGGIAMNNGGYVRGGQSDYNTGTGFFLGYSGGYKFSIGDGSTKGITWDGTTLTIGGNAVIGASTISTIANNAANALQSGANITSLTNNAGYQNNTADKTGGSVGGWTIAPTTITSNNGQTKLFNTGIISLTDGSTERIRITKDNLATTTTSLSSTTSATGTNNVLSSTNGTSWNYGNSRSVSYDASAGYSSEFSISQDSLTLAITYPGSASGNQAGIGTAFQSGISSITGYQYSTYTFTATLSITLQYYNGSSWVDISTQTKQIYRESFTGQSNGAVSTGYSSGVTSAAFGSLNTGYQHRVGIGISWNIYNAAIAYSFISSGLNWTLSTVQYQIPAQSFAINAFQLGTKLEIGLNGIQISSAGGLTAIGAAAGSGLAGTFTGDVKVQGSVQAASFVSTSDERLKTDIKEIDSPMVKLSQLNPKSFLWNDATAPLTDKGYSYGFIAQDVQNYFPELVKIVKDSPTIDNLLTVEYNAIIALNTAAIKQLVSKIEMLEDRILELEEQTQ